MTEIERAYVAGLFDGEGSIGFMFTPKRGYTGSIRCRVGMKGDKIPTLFKQNFGGRTTLFKNGVTQWDVAAKEAVSFLTLILPYLKLKSEQAEIAIKYQSRLTLRGHKELSVEEKNIRLGFYNQLIDSRKKSYV